MEATILGNKEAVQCAERVDLKIAPENIANESWEVDGVKVSVAYSSEEDQRVSEEEIKAYISRGNCKNKNTRVSGLILDVEGEDVGITYELEPVPFERIRRITGYLVGTMDRWNDAKSKEEHDRVKHCYAM